MGEVGLWDWWVWWLEGLILRGILGVGWEGCERITVRHDVESLHYTTGIMTNLLNVYIIYIILALFCEYKQITDKVF